MTRRRGQLPLTLTASFQWSAVTLGELLRAFVDNHEGAENTVRNYRFRITTLESVVIDGRVILDYHLHEIDPRTAQRVHDALRQHVKPDGTRARSVAREVVKMCRTAWRWGRRPVRGLIPGEVGSPWSDVEIAHDPAIVPHISSEIVREIWKVLGSGEVPRVDQQPLDFLKGFMLTGLRPWDELLPLQCQQIYRAGSRWAIRIPKHKTVRRVGPQVLGLGDEAAKIFLAQREHVGGRGNLWPGLRGKGRMTKETVKRAWRHGLATTALEQGVHLKEVQAMLRHRSAQTTLLHYAHTAPGLEVVGANKVAAYVVHGAGSTIDDLARVVGCDPSMHDAVATANNIANRLGVDKLSTVEDLMTKYAIDKGTTIEEILAAFQRPTHSRPPDLPGSAGEFSHERFLWALKNAGIVPEGEPSEGETLGANALARAINASRKARGIVKVIDAKTCWRWISGARPAPASQYLGEIALVLGVSLDWLLCLSDEPLAGSMAAPAAEGQVAS